MRTIRAGLLAGVLAGAAALLAGCTATGASDAPPTWVPSPSGPAVEGNPGARLQPILPIPSGGQDGTGSPSSSASSPSTTKQDDAVVATKLTAPVGLSVLPDGSALVGERTTGRMVRVQPKPRQPVPTVRTLTGLDTTGDGGLLDLAVSPTYTEDGLIYAYVTTPTDNRVVDFTLTGPVTPVLTGIPKGRTGNTGRLLFGPGGVLYVGTGDAGRPALAANPKSLAGKVLRVDSIGHAVKSNPSGTAVYTRGHTEVDGLCGVSNTTRVLEVETGAGGRPDEVNLLRAGASYGPTASVGTQKPVSTLPATDRSPGGCAVNQGQLWVTTRDGRALLSAPITGSASALAVGKYTVHLRNTYGRLRTVVADPGGQMLWLTTTNRDGRGKPVADDERVILYRPSAGGGTSKA